MPSLDITILGGLPVTIKFTESAADPSVGIMSAGINEWWITHVNGRKRAHCGCIWIYNRIDKAKGEEDRIIEKLNDYLNGMCDNDYPEGE